MDLLRKKIQGASILESLVAMSIILLSVTLTAVIYSGISGQSNGLKSVLFQNRCEQIMNGLDPTSHLNEKITESHENYHYEISIQNYMNNKNLIQVKIQVKEKEKEKKVFEFNRLMSKRENEKASTDT